MANGTLVCEGRAILRRGNNYVSLACRVVECPIGPDGSEHIGLCPGGAGTSRIRAAARLEAPDVCPRLSDMTGQIDPSRLPLGLRG